MENVKSTLTFESSKIFRGERFSANDIERAKEASKLLSEFKSGDYGNSPESTSFLVLQLLESAGYRAKFSLGENPEQVEKALAVYDKFIRPLPEGCILTELAWALRKAKAAYEAP